MFRRFLARRKMRWAVRHVASMPWDSRVLWDMKRWAKRYPRQQIRFVLNSPP